MNRVAFVKFCKLKRIVKEGLDDHKNEIELGEAGRKGEIEERPIYIQEGMRRFSLIEQQSKGEPKSSRTTRVLALWRARQIVLEPKNPPAVV